MLTLQTLYLCGLTMLPTMLAQSDSDSLEQLVARVDMLSVQLGRVSVEMGERLQVVQNRLEELRSCTQGCGGSATTPSPDITVDLTLDDDEACGKECRYAAMDCPHLPDSTTSCIVYCPPVTSCTGSMGRTVWGTDYYTSDSGLCRSAVHSGVIPATGGSFKMYVTEGLSSYQGNVQNDIVSREYGSYSSSCRYEPVH